jgi:hypothetical protein
LPLLQPLIAWCSIHILLTLPWITTTPPSQLLVILDKYRFIELDPSHLWSVLNIYSTFNLLMICASMDWGPVNKYSFGIHFFFFLFFSFFLSVVNLPNTHGDPNHLPDPQHRLMGVEIPFGPKVNIWYS